MGRFRTGDMDALQARSLFAMAGGLVLCVITPFICLPIERLTLIMSWLCCITVIEVDDKRINAFLRFIRGGFLVVLIISDCFILIQFFLIQPAVSQINQSIQKDDGNITHFPVSEDELEQLTQERDKMAWTLFLFYSVFFLSSVVSALASTQHNTPCMTFMTVTYSLQVIAAVSFETMYTASTLLRANLDQAIGNECIIAIITAILVSTALASVLTEIKRKMQRTRLIAQDRNMQLGFRATFTITSEEDEEDELYTENNATTGFIKSSPSRNKYHSIP